ncbi:MAG: FmdB family zinc ribbon protein [Treponema sp.]
MPAYDYYCESCSKTFEIVQKMSDPPVTVCPHCGGAVRQVFSAGFGLNFTGKGFYTTDTHKKSTKKTTDTGTEKKSCCSSGSCSCGCSS